MPKITVVDFMRKVEKEFEVEKGTKLLKALIDHGVDLVHTCGGNAKCTTCRVNIDVGTPTKETQAQKDLFAKKVKQGLPQFGAPRMFLSCQILVENDMMVSPSERFNHVIHDSVGKDTGDEITPDPVWVVLERE
jgi:ferredoxin